MNIVQKRKILKRISDLENDIGELKRCQVEIAKCGFASASMSSGSGSKSYTRTDLTQIAKTIQALTSELEQLRGMLVNVQQTLWHTILTVYA